MIGAGWPLAALTSEPCKHEPSRLGAIDPLLTVEDNAAFRRRRAPSRCGPLDGELQPTSFRWKWN